METTHTPCKEVGRGSDKAEVATAPPPYSADHNNSVEIQTFGNELSDVEVGLIATSRGRPVRADQRGTASLLCSGIVEIVDRILGFLKFLLGCHPMPCSLLFMFAAILGFVIVLLAAGTAVFGPEFLIEFLRALRGTGSA